MTCPPPARYGKEKQNSFKVDEIFSWIKVHLLLVTSMEIWWNSAIDSGVLHFFTLSKFKSFVHINIELYKGHSNPSKSDTSVHAYHCKVSAYEAFWFSSLCSFPCLFLCFTARQQFAVLYFFVILSLSHGFLFVALFHI